MIKCPNCGEKYLGQVDCEGEYVFCENCNEEYFHKPRS